jgi:hypothetical protein
MLVSSSRSSALAALAAALALVVASAPASADTGTVTVTATNNAKITMTIGSATANFGTALDPTGAGTGGQVGATAPSGTGDQGVYYVWSPGGALVTVKSNKTWNGYAYASENSGSATSLSIASGALRFDTSAPTAYSAASAASAFAIAPSTLPTTGNWQTNHANGTSSFSYDYLLRVDWTDDPGTFSSTVTYTATQ